MNEKRQDLPPLAQYKSTSEYIPSYGDHIVWTGWFTTWHGVVANYDTETQTISIIFSNIPFMLFTYTDEEQINNTRNIKLSKIVGSSHGKWAILKHDYIHNTNVWYI